MSNENPIIKAWQEHPEMRPEFIRFLSGNYTSLFKGLKDDCLKGGQS